MFGPTRVDRVRVYGEGIKRGIVGEEAKFGVDYSIAGAGPLCVMLLAPPAPTRQSITAEMMHGALHGKDYKSAGEMAELKEEVAEMHGEGAEKKEGKFFAGTAEKMPQKKEAIIVEKEEGKMAEVKEWKIPPKKDEDIVEKEEEKNAEEIEVVQKAKQERAAVPKHGIKVEARSRMVEYTVQSLQKGVDFIKYTPKFRGNLRAFISFGGKRLSGSPFKIKVITAEERQEDLKGVQYLQ